jgi:hypothetical protein
VRTIPVSVFFDILLVVFEGIGQKRTAKQTGTT